MGLGEYPLSFAACTNQRDMVDLLLEFGADVSARDSDGNTVFHHLMRKENLGMYDYLVKWSEGREKERGIGEGEREKKSQEGEEKEEKAERGEDEESESALGGEGERECECPWDLPNEQGMTPFTFSAYLGSEKMFCALLEKRREMQWRYGSVTCYLYPLEDLDTPLKEMRTRQPALHWIVHNEHLDLLRQTRIAELLRKKWERFAERIFLRKLFFTLFYLSAFTLSSILYSPNRTDLFSSAPEHSPVTPTDSPDPPHTILSWMDHFRDTQFSTPLYLFAELVVVLGALNKGWGEVREMSRVGLSDYWKCSGALFVENSSSSSSVLLLALSYALRFLSLPGQVVARSLAGLMAYVYMLFFFLGFRLTGPFIVIVGRMASVDLVRFFLLFSVFLFGYSHAFYVLFEDEGAVAFVERIRRCFMVILGK